MQTTVSNCQWQRRGAAHTRRRPVRKREHRHAGFISPHAARLRRCMKRQRHRSTRRRVRANLRAYLLTLTV